MATSTTSAIDVARTIMDAGNAHDLDEMASHYAEVIEEQLPDRVLRSRAELRTYMGDLLTAMPDFRFDIHAMAEDGDQVLMQWTLTGTQTGVFEGIKPTGRPIAMRGSERMTIRDGRLVANVVVFDRTAVGQQLGLMPPDGSPGERAMKAAFNARTALKRRFSRR